MSPSWNHRRAMPVVTMTMFQLGVSGVASRSRLITRTRELAHARTEMLLEVRLDVEAHRELDRLAGSACRCDHDHAARGRLRPDERVVVGREVSILYVAHAGRRGEKRARPADWLRLLPVLAELADERHPPLLPGVVGVLSAVPVVVTEDHLAVRRAIADRRRTVRRRGLLFGRHVVQPDPAHPLGGTIFLRDLPLLLLGVRHSGQTGRADES